MTEDAKLVLDNRQYVKGMEEAAKASDELFQAVSRLSNQGGSAFATFSTRGAAAAKMVGEQFGPELSTAIKNLQEKSTNSANYFSATSKRIRKSFEDDVVNMLGTQQQFSLEYFRSWQNLGATIPSVLKPIYTGLLADEKAATVAVKEQSAQRVASFKQEADQRASTIVRFWKEDNAAAKMGGELRRIEEARYQAWLKAAGEEQATREKLQAENRGTWAKISADFKISEERRYQAWLKAAAAEQSAREKLQSEKVKAEIQQRNDWAAAQESKFQQVVKTARAQVAAANKEREASYTSWWKTELAKRDAIQNEYARKMAANGDVMKDMFIANENAKIAAVKRTQLAVEASAVSQVRGAMLSPSGAFSQLSNQKLVLPKEQVTGFTGALKHMNTTMKQTVVDGNDLHSAMRGLASGFNLLWLTWGNLAPLFAGAAISFGVKGVITLGSQVQHTFETIKVLSGETTESVKGLNEQMMAIAESGPVGPLAVAEAMKTLSLAGLNASQVSASIKDVLNFAVAGDVDIKKASDVMTTVATAFSISAEAYNVVGDAIAKTAAVSKSSVEDIGEAFKTSSVLHKQYGVSLTDVGVGLAALANLGIKGSAAGTALRNMYVDLSGRTKEVAQTLKAAGIELRDQTTGNFKNIVQMVEEYDAALSKLKGKAQKDFLQATLSERGGKPIVELRDLLHRQAEEAGTTISNKLQELQREIEDRAGFAIMAAAKLQLTPLNQMKSVVSTMQVELVRAFDAASPAITAVSAQLKNMFRSPEFRAGLENLVTTFGRLAVAVTENIGPLTKLLGLYVAFSVGKGILQVATSLTSTFGLLAIATTSTSAAMAAAGTATVATTRTMTAAAVAATGLSSAMAFLGPIGAVLAAGATAWQLWAFFQDKANDGVKKAATDGHYDTYLDYLREESKRLDENTEALKRNISVEELRREKQAKAASDAMRAAAQVPLDTARKRHQDSLAALRKYETDHPGSEYRERVDKARLTKEVATAQAALRKLEQEASVKEYNTLMEEVRIKNKAKGLEALQAKKDADALAAQPRGTGGFTQTDPATKAAADRQARLAAATQLAEFKATNKGYENATELAEAHYRTQATLLDNAHKNKLISEGEYQATLLRNAQSHDEELGEISWKAQTSAMDEYVEAKAKLEKTLAGADLKSEMQKLDAAYASVLDKLIVTDDKRVTAGLLRVALAGQDAAGRVKALGLEIDKFLAEDANALAAGAVEIGEAFDKYAAAGMGAAAKEAEKYANMLDKVKLAMAAAVEGSKEMGELKALVERLEKAQAGAVAKASENAINKLKAADFRKFTASIADAIVKGGVNAGPELRAILEEEFLKEPFRVLINAVISDVSTGGLSKLLSGDGATMGQLAKIGSNLKGVYDFVTSEKTASWFSSGGFGSNIASGASSLGSNMYELGAWSKSGWMKDALKGSGSWLADNAAAIGKYAEAAGTALAYLNAADAAAQGKWGAAIGQAVGTAYFGPLGGAVGGAIGGWVDDAFGGGRESSLGGGITGTFGTNGQFSGQRFDRRRNSGQSGFLGIGATSAREWDNYSSLETGISTALSVQFFMLKAQTAAFAESLGLSTSSITAYTRAMRLSLGSDAAANQKAIADFFTTMANEMAAGLIDRKYFKEGETAADALARLSVNLTSVNSAFELMGKGKFSATLNSALGADALVTIFGGKDKFDSAQASFYNAFYSDAEKQANLKKSLETSFATLGKTLPATRDAFRQMVVAQDVTTDSGRQTYAQLLSLSEAFDSLTATAKKASEAVSETDFSTQVAYLRFKGRLGLGGSVAGLSKTPGFATGGVHSGGWRVVGEEGAELEHTGPSRIYNNADSLFDDANIVAQLKALREEISYLRADARATAANTKKAANVYDKWDADGMPEVRA